MIRSLLYVPANSERFIGKAHERGADAIILDLEDSVPQDQKLAARQGLMESVASVSRGDAKVFVRINRQEDFELPEIVAACAAGAHGVFIPKLRRAQEIADFATLLEHHERRLGRAPMQFVGLIEDPGAVLDAREIAKAPRLIGLAAGGEDLALALGATPTPDVLHFPKLMVHYAAKAAGLLSFGLLRSVADYADGAGVAAAAKEAREHGFDGATCVHPLVVPLLNAAFAPSAEELDWARRVVDVAAGQGGAFVVDGRMVDAPVIARARRILGSL
jgi:citrate lyase subunit beta/citryl-CoA lyase